MASALIVSSRLCCSNAFQLIINPFFSNNDFKSLKINSRSENFRSSLMLVKSWEKLLKSTSNILYLFLV